MKISGTQVHEEFREAPGFTVDFRGKGDEIVSGSLRADDSPNQLNGVTTRNWWISPTFENIW